MSLAPSEDAPLPVVSVGEIVSGKFRVERVIGEGGMGIVVEATHLQLEERVALKFLHRAAMAMPDVVSRFAQEARAAVRLKSAHVARVIDVGTREDGVPYIVMEYLQGRDLGRVLADRGALPVGDAVEYVIQACEALSEAHARGIIHRDLKPENLFLVEHEDGWQMVKVLDFGISKAALTGSAADPVLASHQTTTLLGSPYYMSPEQLRSTREVDARADVWSLGATLFELLSATTAFDDTKQFTELVAEILEQPHRRLLDYRKDASPELQEVVDRCLAKDRGGRYQSAAELALALLPFAPRRARVPAERAVSLARAAGALSDPRIALPPSQFPAAERSSGALAVLPPSSSRLPATGAGTAVTEPAPPDSLPAKSVGGPGTAPPEERSKAPLWVALGVVALLVGGVTWFARGRGGGEPTPGAASSEPAASIGSTVPVTTAAPSASPSVAATTTAPTSETVPAPSASIAAGAKEHASPRPPTQHGHRPPPASSKGGATPASTLDIRLER